MWIRTRPVWCPVSTVTWPIDPSPCARSGRLPPHRALRPVTVAMLAAMCARDLPAAPIYNGSPDRRRVHAAPGWASSKPEKSGLVKGLMVTEAMRNTPCGRRAKNTRQPSACCCVGFSERSPVSCVTPLHESFGPASQRASVRRRLQSQHQRCQDPTQGPRSLRGGRPKGATRYRPHRVLRSR